MINGNGTAGHRNQTKFATGLLGRDALITPGDVDGDATADVLLAAASWITGTTSKVETVGVNCATTVSYPDVTSDVPTTVRVTGVPPLRGLNTKTETALYSGGVADTFVTTSSGFDTFGRAVWVKGPRGNPDRHRLHPQQRRVDDNPQSVSPPATAGGNRMAMTTSLEALRGQPISVTDANNKVTTGTYDPLGRVLKVVTPGNTTGSGDAEHVYSITKTAAPNIQTKPWAPTAIRSARLRSWTVCCGPADPGGHVDW